MEPNKTAIERAFELARTGLFLEVVEIKERLRGEGYFTDTITGPLLYEQLKSLIEMGQKSRWKGSSRTRSTGTTAAARVSRPRAQREFL